MRVKNHKNYACFEYTSQKIKLYKLGDIVRKDSEDGTEIGVIIQIHDANEYRTDMFGNCSSSEIKMATKEDIENFRAELLNDLKK